MSKKRGNSTGLFKHPKSQFWYFKVKHWDPETQKFKWSSPRSSKTTDPILAQQIKAAAQEAANAMAPPLDVKVAHEEIFQIINGIADLCGCPRVSPKMAPTWETLKNQFLENQKRKLESSPTRKPGIDPLGQWRNYKSQLARFTDWIDGDPVITQIDREAAQSFYWHLLESGYQPSTAKKTIAILKRMFDRAREDGHIDRNPFAKLETTGNQYRQKEPFTLEDIHSIWSNIEQLEHSEEWRTVVLFGLVLGARIKDCSIRTWEEVVLSEPPHIVFHPGKTEKRGIVVKAPLVNPLLSRLLETAGDEGGMITPNLASMPTETLSARFSGFLRDINIPMREEPGKKTWYSKGFHSWRHTLPSLLAARDVPAEIRMQITGHTDGDTHHQYTHYDDSRLRGVLAESLDGILVHSHI